MQLSRYIIFIEYNGTKISGFNNGDIGDSIVDLLQNAYFNLCQRKSEINIAGRTDRGVHAINNAIHLDFPDSFSHENILKGLNYYLKGKAIKVNKVIKTHNDFHATRDCCARTYFYMIKLGERKNTLFSDNILNIAEQVDIEKMQKAANLLIGEHDFSTYRASQCQAKNAIRIIYDIKFHQYQKIIFVIFHAKSYLYRQIRSMMGSLLEVGNGKETIKGFEKRFKSMDRKHSGKVLPPNGLYFFEAHYENINYYKPNIENIINKLLA